MQNQEIWFFFFDIINYCLYFFGNFYIFFHLTPSLVSSKIVSFSFNLFLISSAFLKSFFFLAFSLSSISLVICLSNKISSNVNISNIESISSKNSNAFLLPPFLFTSLMKSNNIANAFGVSKSLSIASMNNFFVFSINFILSLSLLVLSFIIKSLILFRLFEDCSNNFFEKSIGIL